MTIYEDCAVSANGSNDAMMRCIADVLEKKETTIFKDTTRWLLVVTGALVFFMQTGFAMLCAGCVRKKNVQNTMLKNLLDACGAAVAFYMVGYAFAFGGQSTVPGQNFIGLENFFCRGDVDFAVWFFQYAFSATSVTIVAGTLAERCQMTAYLFYSFFLTGFVYPVIAHALWSSNGYLSAFARNPLGGVGAIDFSGSGVIHLCGGTTSLVAVLILGPRKGRFYDSRGRPLATPKEFPGHSMALQLLGTFVLWFGWYGFNPGSALLLTVPQSPAVVGALAATTTSLSAAAGAISALFTNLILQERKTGEYVFSLTMAMNGLLSGLVAITAPCATVEPWAAIIIGIVAGWLYILGSAALIRWKIDDAVDAIPVHLTNGVWGLIATGLFSTPDFIKQAYGTDGAGLFYSFRNGVDFTLFGNQVLATLYISGWCCFTMVPFFFWLNYMGWLRSDSLEELVGLDMSYMGGASREDGEPTAEEIQAYHSKKTAYRRNRNPDDTSSGDHSGWGEMSADVAGRPKTEDDESTSDHSK